MSVRCRTSKIELVDLSPSPLFDALVALPRRLCGPKQYGLWMSPVFYRGQWRNPNYAENRIKDHQRGVEKMGCPDKWPFLTYELLRILASNLGFLTYDKLNTILVKKGYNWNQLVSMKEEEREDLEAYPAMSEEEELSMRLEQVMEAEAEAEEAKATRTPPKPAEEMQIEVQVQASLVNDDNLSWLVSQFHLTHEEAVAHLDRTKVLDLHVLKMVRESGRSEEEVRKYLLKMEQYQKRFKAMSKGVLLYPHEIERFMKSKGWEKPVLEYEDLSKMQ